MSADERTEDEGVGARVNDLLGKYADELPPDPARYFGDNGGLLVATLADDLLDMGPLAEGVDGQLWSHEGGVWVPAPHAVRDRAVTLLDDRYRSSHASNVDDVVRASVPTLTSDPVERYINFTNGLLDWRTGELVEHTPDVLSTVQLSVPWEPEATCPTFDTWLTQVVDADVIDMVWEIVGYLMYSGNPLHKAFMLTGGGRNGKGTLLRAVIAMIGKHNTTASSLYQLVSTRFHVAQLFGKLANIAGDIDPKYLESTATFKAITGEDLITGERKYGHPFDFTCWAVPVFSANKVPGSADVTVGYLSRWVVVDFPNDFTGREDRGLDDKLHAELAGVAARAVPALRRLLDRGDFHLSPSAVRARDKFNAAVDQVRTWIDVSCELDPKHKPIKRTEVYTAYRVWAEQNGYARLKSTEFYNRLQGVDGVYLSRTEKGRWVHGLALPRSWNTAGELYIE